MADKMLRIAGKDQDSLARGIRVDGDGVLLNRVKGSDIAVPVDLQYHDLQAESAIPTYRVSRTEIETWIDNETIIADSTIVEPFSHRGETETYFLISTDSNSFAVRANAGIWSLSLSSSTTVWGALYPRSEDGNLFNKPYTEAAPLRLLYVMEGEYNSFKEAYDNRQLNNGRLYVKNYDSVDANFTVKILRIWK